MLDRMPDKAAIVGACVCALSIFISAHNASAQDGQGTTATCVADGRSYIPGEIACIPACYGQQRLAKCEQTDTGAGWTNISDRCPTAMSPEFPGSLLPDVRLAMAPITMRSSAPLQLE